MKWITLFTFAFLTACQGNYENVSLQQFSIAPSEEGFTARQNRDLSNLLKELYEYTYHNESCSQIRTALDNNTTLNNLEQVYNLTPHFIYDEFTQFINLSNAFNSPQTTEQAILLSIISLWKKEASATQLQSIIVKIRRCYPQ